MSDKRKKYARAHAEKTGMSYQAAINVLASKATPRARREHGKASAATTKVNILDFWNWSPVVGGTDDALLTDEHPASSCLGGIPVIVFGNGVVFEVSEGPAIVASRNAKEEVEALIARAVKAGLRVVRDDFFWGHYPLVLSGESR